MNRHLRILLFVLGLVASTNVLAQQRYLSEVFTDAQITVTNNVVYARNHLFFPPTTTYPVDSLRMRVY